MESTSLIAISRARVLEQQMDVLSNNIANVNTAGYKAQRIMFKVDQERPVPAQPLDFVDTRSTYLDLSAGDMRLTGNNLDVALNGDGYFAVTMPDGKTGYTRNGAFTLNSDGTLVDPAGNPVQGEGGSQITIPAEAKSINIGTDGTISTDTSIVGKIAVNAFANSQQLRPHGDGYYVTDKGAPTPALSTRVVQGAIEGSNVRAVSEMTDMMQVVRSYQSVQNLLNNEHERIRNAISRITRAV